MSRNLELHLMEGAAIKTSLMGKAHIDIHENGGFLLDFENGDDEILEPNEVRDIILAEVYDENPVTVWFLPETDRSKPISVPINDHTSVNMKDGGWSPDELQHGPTLERVQKAVRNDHGEYLYLPK